MKGGEGESRGGGRGLIHEPRLVITLIKTSNFYVVIVLVNIRHRIAENSYYRLPIAS